MIQDVNLPGAEVRRQQEASRRVCQQGQSLVNGKVLRIVESHDCVVGASPVGHDAIFSIKDEEAAVELASGVSYGSGRAAGAARGHRRRGYAHNQ